MAMQTFFSTDDWYVEESPIRGWGFNEKGTFYIVVLRTFNEANGPQPYNLYLPKNKVGNLPAMLDQVPEEKRPLLRCTGGRRLGFCEATCGFAIE